MHMHATPCDGTFQKALIRKLPFIVLGHRHCASAIHEQFFRTAQHAGRRERQPK